LFIPNKGDVCFGKVIGSYRERVIVFSANYRAGIAINGGGCFKTDNYSTSEILRYLRNRGINYPLLGLPEPTQSPTRSPVPTATVVGYLPISFETIGNTLFLPIERTVCWGNSVANLDYKVVRFPRTLKTPVYIKRGACTVGTNLSAEDVFNYLKQRTSVPINGFLDFP
jgi:hypothetical protein